MPGPIVEPGFFPGLYRPRMTPPPTISDEASPQLACPLARLFVQQVAQRPIQVALMTDFESVTFEDLHERSRYLAFYLMRARHRPLVALLVPSGEVGELCALFAVLLAGGSFVPIEPGLPTPRKIEILKDATPSVVITLPIDEEDRRYKHERSWRSALSPEVPVISISNSGHFQGGHQTQGSDNASNFMSNPPSNADDSEQSDGKEGRCGTIAGNCLPGGRTSDEEDRDLLYLMYTSGTTGKPKGVRGTRSGALNRIRFAWNTFPFKPCGDIVARRTPLSFVDSIAEVFSALLAGVPLYLPPQRATADPTVLIPALSRSGATRLTLTPSLLSSMLRLTRITKKELPPALHMWMVSGEALHVELALEFCQLAAPGSQLINLYGSTEVAGDATYCTLDDILGRVPMTSSVGHTPILSTPSQELENGENLGMGIGARWRRGSMIGRPIPGVSLMVVSRNSNLTPVPDGEQGELVVGGVGVALGYHCRPQETSEKFLFNNNVFSPSPDRPHCDLPRDNLSDPHHILEDDSEFRSVPRGGRLFRTGDLVVRESDGLIYWLGRLDEEVKVRGVRVSLEGAEALGCKAVGVPMGSLVFAWDPGRKNPDESDDGVGRMSSITAATDSAVVGESNAPDRGRLLGFYETPEAASTATAAEAEVCVNEGRSPGVWESSEDLKRLLAKELSPAQLPSLLISVPGRFPLTTSGKVDRQRLLRLYREYGNSKSRLPSSPDLEAGTCGNIAIRGRHGPAGDRLEAARTAVAKAVCVTLPGVKERLEKWLSCSPSIESFETSIASFEGKDLSFLSKPLQGEAGGIVGVGKSGLQGELIDLSFTELGGTSMLAVEAAWLASCDRDTEGGVTAPLPLLGANIVSPAVEQQLQLQASDLLSGTLNDAAARLVEVWSMCNGRHAADVLSTGVGASTVEFSLHPSRPLVSPIRKPPYGASGDCSGSQKDLLVVKGTDHLLEEVQAPGKGPNGAGKVEEIHAEASDGRLMSHQGRKRRRPREAQPDSLYAVPDVHELPRSFLAVGRAGSGLGTHSRACLEGVGEVMPSRVEIQVKWSMCLKKCIDATPLVVVPHSPTPTTDVPPAPTMRMGVETVTVTSKGMGGGVEVETWRRNGVQSTPNSGFCGITSRSLTSAPCNPNTEEDRYPCCCCWMPYQGINWNKHSEGKEQPASLKRISPTLGRQGEFLLPGSPETSEPTMSTSVLKGRGNLDEAVVYIGSHSGIFQALNLQSGELKWSVSLGGRIESGAAYSTHRSGGILFVGCHDGLIYALGSDQGNVVWTFQTGDVVKCTPVTLCNDIWSATDLSTNANVGSGAVDTCWRNEETQGGDGRAQDDPCATDKADMPSNLGFKGVILTGSHDGWLYCLSQCLGQLRWKVDCGGSLFASPAHDPSTGAIYACTIKGCLLSIIPTEVQTSTTNGAIPLAHSADSIAASNTTEVDCKVAGDDTAGWPRVSWERWLPAPCFSTPAVCHATSTLILGCVNGGVYCFSAEGEEIWACLRATKPVFSSPCLSALLLPKLERHSGVHLEQGAGAAVFKGAAIIGSHDGILRSVSITSGCILWETLVGEQHQTDPPGAGPSRVEKVGQTPGLTKGSSDPLFASAFVSLTPCSGCAQPCPLVYTCAASSGSVAALRLSDGAIVGRTTLLGELFSSPVLVGPWLVVGCRDNHAYGMLTKAWCMKCSS